jgi:flagellar P-ring protein precursor FlgI
VEPCQSFRLQLRSPDYATAAHITRAIDEHFGENQTEVARADNAAVITVEVPARFRTHTVDFIAALQELSVDAEHSARVVVNERTGTVVVGRDVTISPVTILHGPLTVEIQTTETVSQPLPVSKGETVVLPQTRVAAKQEPVRNVSLKAGATVDELVRALVVTGSTPRDIIAVLQALKAAGVIEADLEVI